MSIVAASHNNDATDVSASYTHRHQVYAADAAGTACQSLRSHSHSSGNVVQTTKRSDGHSKRQLNQYQLIGGKIGKGQHGHVRKAVYGSQTFAIKVVSRTPTKHKQLRGAANGPNNPLSRAREQSEHAPLVHKINSTENKIRKEIAIMKKCQHHHVVRIHEVIDDPLEKRIYLVLDYMGGGEIRWRQTVGNHTRPLLSLGQIRSIFRDVVLGLQYLHYQGIIHRDIKPANILWNEDRSSVKLGDLGSAHFSYALRLAEAGAAEAGLDEAPEDVLMDEGDLSKTAGSPAFFAPEICFQGDDYDGTVPNYNLPPQYQITKAIDIWALGITLYCLLFGTSPYDDINNEYQLYQVIPKFSFTLPPTMTVDNLVIANLPKDSLGAQSLNMLDRLLQKNPVNRATIDEIKRHPFVTAGMANPEGWIRDTNPARHALVEVTQQDTENTIVTRWNVRGMWRNLTHKRATAQPPSRQGSAGAMDTLVSPSNGALGRSRSEKSPHRQAKREITKESIHSHPPSGSGAKSAVELAGSTVEKPRPRLTSSSTSDSMRSRSVVLSSGPPSRSASPARSGSAGRGLLSMLTNFALRRRPKSETTVGQIQGMASASRSSTGDSSAGIIPVPHGEVDEPQCSPTSPGRESASDDDLGHPVSHTPVYDVYSGLRHRISAGSTISVSTHGSEFADTSFSARVLGAGGFPIDHNPPTVASPDGIESVAGSPPSGPSSFRTPPPIQHPSPRLATTPVQFTASARTESWDAEGAMAAKARPTIAPVIPPRTGVGSPLGRVTPKTLESDDSDDVDLLHPAPRPRGNSMPLSPGTPSGRNRYNENDDSDTDSGSEDEESDGANVLHMSTYRRPSMSAQTSPRDPGSPPSVNGSGAQSPLSSPPQQLIGLGVSAIAQQ